MKSEALKKRDGEFKIPDLSSLAPDGRPEFNRLIFSSNPYLLQHARNPVNWFPWCDEAFAAAVRENKPVFLSIGYSTCHWCHVMEHESFEDREVAEFLNRHFISIKVDREERPDLDHIYMDVCQAMTGRGGWPLSLFLTPEKTPFFAGTYFPRDAKHGSPGFLDILEIIRDRWENRKNDLLTTGKQIREMFSKNQRREEKLEFGILEKAVSSMMTQFDMTYGGFGDAPKFPRGHLLSFLMRRYDSGKNPELLSMIEFTLARMHSGGIYDHIGYGFCRYSVDEKWFAPHFEKMLYDNALLTIAYIEAFQITRNDFYKKVAGEILTYINRDMTSPEGGFYSAENADSEGEEGKFYLFSRQEFFEVLGEDDGKLASEYFSLTGEGNFEAGKNILHITSDSAKIGKKFRMSGEELAGRIETVRKKLYQYRLLRIHPSLDDKILVSWNGLMISAQAKAFQVFRENNYLEAGRRAADFILERLSGKKGELLHSWRGKPSETPAFLDDYSFFIAGLLDLYEACFEKRYLESALIMHERMLDEFGGEKGPLFYNSISGEKLFTRPVDGYDGAMPSGNSIAAMNCLRLARLTGKPEYEKKAMEIIHSFGSQAGSVPEGFLALLSALDYAKGPVLEIVISGKSPEEIVELSKIVQSEFLPRKLLVFRPEGEEGERLEKLVPISLGRKMIDGKPTAYVCKNQECSLPVTEPADLLKSLGK